MIEYKNNPNDNVVELAVEGKLTEADFERVITQMSADIEKHGKLRLLEEIRSFEGIDPMALWIDLKQISKINKVSHAAIVADAKWIKTVAGAIGGLYPFEMKVYERSQIEAARAWLASA